MYFSSVTPRRRAFLRQLRAEFEQAFAAVEDMTDRKCASFIEADTRYRAWIKAIDTVALDLLDDIDVFEEVLARLEPTQTIEPTQSQMKSEDVDHLFAEISDLQHFTEIIGTPSLDEVVESTYEI